MRERQSNFNIGGPHRQALPIVMVKDVVAARCSSHGYPGKISDGRDCEGVFEVLGETEEIRVEVGGEFIIADWWRVLYGVSFFQALDKSKSKSDITTNFTILLQFYCMVAYE